MSSTYETGMSKQFPDPADAKTQVEMARLAVSGFIEQAVAIGIWEQGLAMELASQGLATLLAKSHSEAHQIVMDVLANARSSTAISNVDCRHR
jgi:hypothetical protein